MGRDSLFFIENRTLRVPKKVARNAPPIMIPELTYFSWNLASSHKIFQVYTQTAKKYYFNSDMVDDKGKWITQRDVFIDAPFDKLTKIM